MVDDIPQLTPPKIKRLIASYDRAEAMAAQRARERRANALFKATAHEDTKAIEKILGVIDPERIEQIQGTGLKKPAAKLVAKIERADDILRHRVDRSKASTALRQRHLVELLTTPGTRCSLSRAWKLSYGSTHHPSLASLLKSPAILDLFKQAIDTGRSLPSGTGLAKQVLRALELPDDFMSYRDEDISELL